MPKYNKGFFKPYNPQKYQGNPKNIVYRSGWELKFMMYLDSSEGIVKWASEEVAIPYISPIDHKRHRYFVDFLIENVKGEIMAIEIKPLKECSPPILTEGKITRSYKRAAITYAVNQAKWNAAKTFCASKGWDFKVLTERELYGNTKP